MFKNWSKKFNYKFKDLKPYGSLENLYKGNRKYRRVFDESECRYINVELSFYNILFDEEDWETEVTLRAVNQKTGKEISSIKKNIKVTQDQNIVYVREGWGTPDPGFWKKDSYKWEAYIDGKLVGQANFYVMNSGQVAPNENPYFNIKSIRLYESPYEGTPIEQRTYLQTFDHETTRYINVEMQLENLIIEEPHFPLELQFNVYNDTRHLKAHMTYFKNIYDKRKDIVLDTGYGTQNVGFWYEDEYIMEVLFMDELIAVIPFDVSDEAIPFSGSYNYNNYQSTNLPNLEEEKEISFDDAKKELERLIGLRDVKKQINDLSTYLRFTQLRIKKGFTEQQKFNLHTVFMGNPGTGKTTVALMLGRIFKSLGILENGIVHEVSRADLVGEFIGQTAPKVQKLIDKARGGILFIDEAYSLTNRGNDEKDYGREVIEVLLKEMSDGPGNLAIICAGYTQEMEHFLATNPGMSSRFGQVITFPDYTPDELMAIANYMSLQKEVALSPKVQKVIHKNVVEAYRNRSRTFGNARYVGGLIEESKRNMGLRIMAHEDPESLSKEDLATITLEDIKQVFKKRKKIAVKLPVDEALLQDALNDLNSLIGMNNIKNEVHEIIKLVRYYNEIGRNLRDAFSVHTIFTGNPGTGKTTVARLLVRIYKALGILERGHLVECDRKSLVAGFIGQTAIKTSAVIDEAVGGGLFIDEAYSLNPGVGNDFGREAIETILKRMEDQRGEFMVIVAGYPDEMKEFLESNPGLKSRFDKHFKFKDYTGQELLAIADMVFGLENMHMTTAARAFLLNHTNELLTKSNKYFGNARTIRKIVLETVRKQHLRLAAMPPEERTEALMNTITEEDLKHIKDSDYDAGEKRIGFTNTNNNYRPPNN